MFYTYLNIKLIFYYLSSCKTRALSLKFKKIKYCLQLKKVSSQRN